MVRMEGGGWEELREADCQYQYLAGIAGTDWDAADADVEPVQAGKVCNGGERCMGEAVGVFDNCTHIVIRSFLFFFCA